MNLEPFLRDREPSWSELALTLREAGGKPERLGPEGVRRLGMLYRHAAADLALSRRRFPRDPIVERLEALVTRARLLVYPRRARRGELRAFFAAGYWRRVRERRAALALSGGLLVGPAVLAALWALADPGAAIGVVPEAFQGAVDPPPPGGISGGEEVAFTAQLFTHNIRVTFVAFALGITAGIGTAAILLHNGLLLGAVAGLAFEAGNGAAFVAFVAGHGLLELSCVAVCSAAGLRIGWAWVSPGTRTRLAALALESRAAVEVVLGTMPWLVIAGFVEAFVRNAGLPLAAVVAIGLALAALYWAMVLGLGRDAYRGDYSRARRLAST